MKNQVLYFLSFFLMFTTFSYAQKAIKVDRDATASYIPPNFIKDTAGNFNLTTGAFFFDASKRMGIYNIMKNTDGTFSYKYLGEEQPDVVFQTIKEFFAKAGVDVQGKFTIDAEVKTLVQNLVSQLTDKSNALNFLRSSLYRLNESAFNGDIDKEQYNKLFELIVTTTAQIQSEEFELGSNTNESTTE